MLGFNRSSVGSKNRYFITHLICIKNHNVKNNNGGDATYADGLMFVFG